MDYKKYLAEYWKTIEENNEKDYKFGVDVTGYRKEAHIPYEGDYDPDHTLNLYYPDSYRPCDAKLPVIIDIHGGGWMYGNVDVSERYLGFLASKGYAVMAMNYRLLQRTDLAGQIADIFAAMHWLSQYGPDRGFDLSRVLLTGDSAGGHLSILTECIELSRELQEIYGVKPFDFSINAISVSSPVVEMDKLYIVASEETELGRETAKAYVELMLGDKGKSASWNHHMSISEVVPGLSLPPVQIIDSEMDSLRAHTGYLIDILKKNNQRYETLTWSKENGIHLMHVFNIGHWEWKESIEANEKMLEFFDRVCR